MKKIFLIIILYFILISQSIAGETFLLGPKGIIDLSGYTLISNQCYFPKQPAILLLHRKNKKEGFEYLIYNSIRFCLYDFKRLKKSVEQLSQLKLKEI